MRILALDFSSSRRTAALLERRADGWATLANTVFDNVTTAALPRIRTLLESSGATPAEVDLIGVGLGPGSFTGIRSAIVLAQSWHFSRGVPLVGVRGFDSMAAQLARNGRVGRCFMAADARRNELYVAGYDFCDGTARVCEPARLMTMDEALARSVNGEVFAGFDLPANLAPAIEVFPEATVLGILAAERGAADEPAGLEPIYPREPSFVKAPPTRGF